MSDETEITENEAPEEQASEADATSDATAEEPQAASPPSPEPKPKATKKTGAHSVIERFQARQKRLERLGYAAAIVFVGGICIAVWFSPDLVGDAVTILQSIERTENSGNAILNCRKKANRKTPYCMERAARIQGRWKSIQRTSSGESPVAFSLSSSGR